MNQFAERYRTLSNADLLGIIENESGYLPEAIEAARKEMLLRNLSDQELEGAKREVADAQRRNEEGAVLDRKVRNIGRTLLDLINPIQKTLPGPLKRLNFQSQAVMIRR